MAKIIVKNTYFFSTREEAALEAYQEAFKTNKDLKDLKAFNASLEFDDKAAKKIGGKEWYCSIFAEEKPEPLTLSTGYDFDWIEVRPYMIATSFCRNHNNVASIDDVSNQTSYSSGIDL